MHWFDLNVLMPRLHGVLVPGAYLAIIEKSVTVGLNEHDVIPEFSTNQDYARFDLIQALESAKLFRAAGREETDPVDWKPAVEEYIERRHSQNGFSRDRMGEDRAAELAERFEIVYRTK